MPVLNASRRSLLPIFDLANFALCLGLALSLHPLRAQQTPAKPAANDSASPKPKPQAAPAKPPDTRPSEPPPVLQQLNSAL
jgi:hypothetical protein